MIIQNGNVVFKDTVEKKDIRIADGKIEKIAETIAPEKGEAVIDAAGLHVFPGLIDMHVHLREPGFEYKEDIESGSRAAVKGGFTQVCCMPNTQPVADNKVVISYIRHRGEEAGLCKIRPIGAITKGENGEQLADIGEMKKAGAVAISDDGKAVASSRLMRLAMEYASGFGMKCLCHCEDKELADGGVVNEGYNSTLAGLKGIPRAAEDVSIARELCLAESLGVPVHICHVSTYSGVRLIRDAKRAGVKVTAETCPHYFAATDDLITGFDTNTKVNPPIREERDRVAIIEGLKDGTLDAIVTDHAPHHANDKDVEYNLAAFGISGIETSFAFAITYLYKAGALTLSEIADKMSRNPSDILNLGGGKIEAGGAADLTIADLNEEFVVDSAKFVSKGKNTPFNGRRLSGVVKYTLVDGDVKYKA
ncbi:MAG: dihydroorotase [Christensenellaceae bacterium]|nr:dihydroorotase [Clostridia bacterium]PWM02471.1 MAG: dihydroorotase [Clostridiales bacterium]